MTQNRVVESAKIIKSEYQKYIHERNFLSLVEYKHIVSGILYLLIGLLYKQVLAMLKNNK